MVIQACKTFIALATARVVRQQHHRRDRVGVKRLFRRRLGLASPGFLSFAEKAERRDARNHGQVFQPQVPEMLWTRLLGNSGIQEFNR